MSNVVKAHVNILKKIHKKTHKCDCVGPVGLMAAATEARDTFLQPPSKAQVQDWEHACARDSVLCGEKKFIFRDWLNKLEHDLKSRPPIVCKLQHQLGQKFTVSTL